MNRILIFLSVVFLVFAGAGCNQQTSSVKNQEITGSQKAFISGQITNPADSLVLITVGQATDTNRLISTNRFSEDLKLSEPGFFALRHGTHVVRIFVNPNDSLFITFDNRDIFNTIKFDGKGSIANEYLKQKYVLMMQQTLPLEQLYNHPVKEFRHLIDSLYVLQKMLLEGYKEQHPEIPDNFVLIEESALLYDRATSLMEYPEMSSYANQIDKSNYFKFLDQLSVNDSSLLSVFEYQTFLKAFIDYQADQVMKSSIIEELKPSDKTLIKMQTVARFVQNSSVKNQLLFQLLDEQVKYHGYKNAQLLFEVFEQQCTDQKLKNELLISYQNFHQLSIKGPAPEFSMMDRNGKLYSLNDFKGQYLYIDIWATWCLPCHREASYFEKQEKSFRNKNIAFISISIDQKNEDWLEYLTIKQVSGKQYRVTDTEKFLETYMIKTIPHFLIIDPDGNLLDPDAVRPSENKTEWLERLPDKKAL